MVVVGYRGQETPPQLVEVPIGRGVRTVGPGGSEGPAVEREAFLSWQALVAISAVLLKRFCAAVVADHQHALSEALDEAVDDVEHAQLLQLPGHVDRAYRADVLGDDLVGAVPCLVLVHGWGG
jgi:hypothetical protein